MSRLIDALERLVFGATAQEAVDMRAELAARRAEQRLMAALTEIATDGPEFDVVYDDAFVDALARGLAYEEAHAEAARVADEWKAARVRGGDDARR